MQTLVLRIPDSLAADLRAEAEQRKVSKSVIARERLLRSVAPDQEATGYGLIADLIGCSDAGPPDMSSNVEKYLQETGYGRPKRAR